MASFPSFPPPSSRVFLLLAPLLTTAGAVLAAPSLAIFPEKISLQGTRAQQTLVVQATDDEGLTRDVTKEVKWALADAKVATLDANASVLRPKMDGQTTLQATWGKVTASAALEVTKASDKMPISFRRDVMPIFLRAGCNSGSCHGAGRGQDGFRLSLFGYDPVGDHYRLCEEMPGRRLDLVYPEKSLLIEKSLGAVSHTGGELFKKDSSHFKILTQWIAEGATHDVDTPEPLSIRLLPEKMVLRKNSKQPATQRTVVMARYPDGTERDVTPLCLYLSNNDAVATINKDGVVRTAASGAAFLFARFSKFTVGSEAIVLPEGKGFQWPEEAVAKNFVDEAVFDRLKKLQISPSPLAGDAAFLRRVSLDLTALPPKPELVASFMADTAPDKREKLVDTLLASSQFTDLWTMKWSEILQVRVNTNDPDAGRSRKSVYRYYEWLRNQVAANRPFNEVVKDLLTAHGSNVEGPQANFYTTAIGNVRKPMERAEDVAQLFLGTRIQCAQCHNHPFDRWTMDDYYGFTAFFSGIATKPGAYASEVFVFNRNDRNTAEHPVDGRAMKPRVLGGEEPPVDGKDPRVALADWMTNPDNDAFARTLANRVWAMLFGRGIIEPVDDARISNPPSNEALLSALAQRLQQGKFDIRQLFRDICNSRTYQLSAETTPSNAADNTCFSHAYVRRLQAEVIADLIAAVTEVPASYSGMTAGTRAVQIHDGGAERESFLKNFGSSKRETVCTCEVRNEPTLTQMLAMMNGNIVDNAISRSKLIERLAEEKEMKPEAGISRIFVQALTREPTAEELAKFMEGQDSAALLAEKGRVKLKLLYQDVLWAAMNTTEFLFNK